jgi:hypothetical protein
MAERLGNRLRAVQIDSALCITARSRFDKILPPTPRYVAQRGVATPRYASRRGVATPRYASLLYSRVGAGAAGTGAASKFTPRAGQTRLRKFL